MTVQLSIYLWVDLLMMLKTLTISHHCERHSEISLVYQLLTFLR